MRRIVLFIALLCPFSFLYGQQALNRANWKLSAIQAVDSQNDTGLESNLLNAHDHLTEIYVDPSSSRIISVQVDAMGNNGMFIFNILNDVNAVIVNTYTSINSTDGIDGNWNLLPSNYIFNYHDGALQRANIPQLSNGHWFRIEFTNNGLNQVGISELGMYEFHTTGRNNYMVLLGASIMAASGGFTSFKAQIQDAFPGETPELQPVVFNLGIPGLKVNGLLSNMDDFLSNHPEAGYVMVHIGGNNVSAERPLTFDKLDDYEITNDFDYGLQQVVQKILDAGKVPILARLTFRDYRTVPMVNGGLNQENGSLPFNFIIDDIIESMTPDFYDPVERRGRVDMYELTLNDQSIIAGDGIHPASGEGYKVVRRWVDTACRYIYTGTHHTPIPYTEYVTTIVQDATSSVEYAESTSEPADVYNARILVAQIGDRSTRIALEDRLNAIVFATEPPLPPSNLSAVLATSPSTLKIDLNWTDESDNEKGFEIYRSNSIDGTYSQIHTTIYDEITFSDTLLSPYTDYYYKVRSYNNLGFSDFTSIATASTLDLPPVPDVPLNLQVSSISYYEMQLNWGDNSNNEWGFRVYRSANMSGPFSEVGIISYNTTQYIDQGLNPNTYYYYKLTSFNGGGESGFSNMDFDRTQSLPDVPNSPSNLILSTARINPTIDLSWDDNSDNELGFIIERSIGDDLNYDSLTAINENITNYSDQEIQPNTIYYYRIMSYNIGGSSQGSDQEAIISPNRSVYINITSYGTTQGGVWNDFDFVSGGASPSPIGTTLSGLKDNYDQVSGISIELTDQFQGWEQYGMTGGAIFPDNVMVRYHYVDNTDNSGELRLHGLESGTSYNIYIMGSTNRTWGSDLYWTSKYTADGQSTTLFTRNNEQQLAQISGVLPDISGSITVEVNPELSTGRGLINALVVERIDPNGFTNYYAKPNTDISKLENWGIFAGGTGGNPLDFTSDDMTYIINSDVTIESDLVIQGVNSNVIISEGAQISINAGINNIEVPGLEVMPGINPIITNLADTCNLKIIDGDVILGNNSSIDIGENTITIGNGGYLNKENTNGKIRSNNGNIIVKGGDSFIHHLYMDETNNDVNYVKLHIPSSGQLQLHTVCNLTGSIKLQSGVFNSNGNLVLVSDQNHTSNVEKIGIQASLVGDATFQRFWQRQVGSYGFFYIGTPVRGQMVADWLNDFWIQGVESHFPGAWKNLNTYSTTTDSWEAITSENDIIDPGVGVNAFMFSSNFSDGNILYENSGEINQGPYSIPLGANAGWNLIANPYPSAIDWDKIDWANLDPDSITGVNAAVYLWDQQNSTYLAWTPILGSIPIASGQGFFVETNTSSAKLIVSEAIKVNQNPTFLRESAPEDVLQITMSNEAGLADKIYIAQRPNATNGFDSYLDAHKKKGSYFNISSFDPGGNELAINTLPIIGQQKIPLKVEGSNGNYSFEFTGLESFGMHKVIGLNDHYLKRKIVLKESSKYDFSINEDTSSYGEKRFEIYILSHIPYIGKIMDMYGKPISEAIVELNNEEYFISDNAGEFQFDVLLGEKHSVIATKTEELKKGAIDLWDLILLRRHLTGRRSFSKPIEYIVADVDQSNSVDIEDMYQLIRSVFRPNKLAEWIIIGPEFEFELKRGKFKADLTYNFQADREDNAINLTGYIPGDLSRTLGTNIRDRSAGKINLYTSPKISQRTNRITIPVVANDFLDVSGLQLVFNWDSSKIKFENLEEETLKDIKYSESNKGITIIWDEERGKSIDAKTNEPLFNLTFIQRSTGVENLEIVLETNESFAINGSLEKVNIHEDFILKGLDSFQVRMAYPNPMNEQITFIVALPSDQKVQISIYNSIGEEVHYLEKIFDAGVNEWTWILENKSFVQGICFVSFKTDSEQIVKKVLVE